jgi:hypothetical protein
MRESNLTINFEPAQVNIMLNALYDANAGQFILTDENGNILTNENDSQLTGTT